MSFEEIYESTATNSSGRKRKDTDSEWEDYMAMAYLSSNSKREDYIRWDEYFMAIALLSGKRSKDPASQVGACIVGQNDRILGVGYNGLPNGCNDDDFPWSREEENKLDVKYMYSIHAEVNAILNKNAADLKGATIYVPLFPCNDCAKLIIQSGIKVVVYMADKFPLKEFTVAAKRLFDGAGVKYREYAPRRSIVIDFAGIDWNRQVQVFASPLKDNKN